MGVILLGKIKIHEIAKKLGIGIYEEENSKGKLVKKTDVHTHMLRGTFATRCAEAKIAPKVKLWCLNTRMFNTGTSSFN